MIAAVKNVRVKNRLERFSFSISVVFLALVCACLFLCLSGVDINYAWLYLFLPFVWLGWVCEVIFFRDSKGMVEILLNFLIISLSILLLFKTASLYDANIYSAKGTDTVIFAANFPAFIPFGGVISYFFYKALHVLGLSVGSMLQYSYVALWVEVITSAFFQGLCLVACNVILKKFKK